MITAIYICLYVFVPGVALWGTYWYMVRPFFIQKALCRIWEIRGDLMSAALEKRPGYDSKMAHDILQNTHHPETYSMITMSMLLASFLRERATTEAEAAVLSEKSEQSPIWLRRLLRMKMESMVSIVILNSPLWWPVICAVYIFAFISEKCRKVRDGLQYTAVSGRVPSPC